MAVDELRLDLDAHALPARHGAVGRGGPAGREVHQRLVPEARVLEGRQVVVRNVVVVDQGADRLFRGHLRQPPDVLGRAAEAGAPEEVFGPVVAPVRRGDRGQVPVQEAGPGSHSCGWAAATWLPARNASAAPATAAKR